jgi:hypothetical protein
VSTAPDTARDARVRACFEAPAAAALQAQVRAVAERLCAPPEAEAVEDLLRGSTLLLGDAAAADADMPGLRGCVFRRSAIKSASASQCAAAATPALRLTQRLAHRPRASEHQRVLQPARRPGHRHQRLVRGGPARGCQRAAVSGAERR